MKQTSILSLLLINTMILLTPTWAAVQTRLMTGVCVPFGQGKGNPAVDMPVIAQYGFSSIRAEIFWKDVETRVGEYRVPDKGETFVNESLKVGVTPLLILDYGNPLYDHGDKPTSPQAVGAFARYAGFMVHHFKGRVKFYEVWNEWDGDTGKTTPGKAPDYVNLLRASYVQMKAADPSVVVIGGAMGAGAVRSDFLDQELAAGMLPYLDGVALHPYVYWESDPVHRAANGWAQLISVEEAKLRDAKHGVDVPIYITEISWPTTAGTRITENVAAAYLAQTFLISRSLSYVKGIWWYDFTDDGPNLRANEQNFGLRKSDGYTEKEALKAFTEIKDVVEHGEYLGTQASPDKNLTILKFRMPDGKEILAVWTAFPASKEVAVSRDTNVRSEQRQILKSAIESHDEPSANVIVERSGMPTLISGASLNAGTVKDHK